MARARAQLHGAMSRSAILLWLVLVSLSSHHCKLDVYIAVLTDPQSHLSATDAYSVGEVAVALINNSTSILQDYQLQLVRWRSGCSDLSPFLAAGVLGGRGGDKVLGVIGPPCSSSALYLGSLTKREALSLINVHTALSARLESRSDYPNSFGIVGSSNHLLRAALHLARTNNWSTVSVFYDESQLYHTSALHQLDLTLPDNFSVREYFISSYIPLADIKFDSRIIFLFTEEVLVRKVLCMAYSLGFIFPAYQFVIAADSFTLKSTTFTTHNGREYSCSADELSVATSGAVFLSFTGFGFNGSSAAFSDRDIYNDYFTFEELVEASTEKVGDGVVVDEGNRLLLSAEFAYLFDALMSLALALNNSRLNPNELSFSESGFIEQHEMIKRELSKLDFDGFSGPVRFGNSGFVGRDVSIHQYSEGGELKLLAILPHRDTQELQFEDGGKFIPCEIGIRKFKYPSREVPLVYSYLGFIVTCAVLLLLITLHILTVNYRKTPSVKADSYKMLHLAYTGCYLLVICNLTHTCVEGFATKFSVSTSCYLWHVINTSVAIGFTMILSTLCVRTWRLYRIFVFYRRPGRFLADNSLMVVIFACVFVDMLIALVWIVVDPIKPTEVKIERLKELRIVRDSNGSVRDVEIVQPTVVFCLSRLFPVWFVFLHLFYIFLTLVLAILGILAQKIPQKKFKLERTLGFNYLITICIFLVAVLYVAFYYISTRETMMIRFILFTVGINVEVLLVCALLFVPPLRPALKTAVTPIIFAFVKKTL